MTNPNLNSAGQGVPAYLSTPVQGDAQLNTSAQGNALSFTTGNAPTNSPVQGDAPAFTTGNARANTFAPAPILPAPNAGAAVSIRALFKRFGQKIAVNGLSLDIPVGSFYGLVGPNGAGKTTTINMFTGMLVPDAGSAMILGHDVWSDVNTAKHLIGLMPQPEQIFDQLTGMQLLVYSGMLRGMDRTETMRRAKDLLAAFDLLEAANTQVSDYSAGMTKKICLATAMIHSPRILVLDEPFEAVDPVSSANIRDILQEYTATGGTVVISSHVMAMVEKMCTHVAVINHGQIAAAGTVEQVANGEDLEERFLQLVGGRHGSAHLSWLDGGNDSDGSVSSDDSVGSDGSAPAMATAGIPVDSARGSLQGEAR